MSVAAFPQVSFTEPVRSVRSTTVRLLPPAGDPVPLRILGVTAQGQAVEIDDATAPSPLVVSLTLQPLVSLSYGTSYRLELTEGITDEDGEALVPYGSGFTTFLPEEVGQSNESDPPTVTGLAVLGERGYVLETLHAGGVAGPQQAGLVRVYDVTDPGEPRDLTDPATGTVPRTLIAFPPRDIAGEEVRAQDGSLTGEKLIAVAAAPRTFYQTMGNEPYWTELKSTPSNLFLYDVTEPDQAPRWVGAANLTNGLVDGIPNRIAMREGRIYSATFNKGIQVVALENVRQGFPTEGEPTGPDLININKQLFAGGLNSSAVVLTIPVRDPANGPHVPLNDVKAGPLVVAELPRTVVLATGSRPGAGLVVADGQTAVLPPNAPPGTQPIPLWQGELRKEADRLDWGSAVALARVNDRPLALVGGYATLAGAGSQTALAVVDLTPMAAKPPPGQVSVAPTVLGFVKLEGLQGVGDILLVGNTAIVSGGTGTKVDGQPGGAALVDLTDPENAQVTGLIPGIGSRMALDPNGMLLSTDRSFLKGTSTEASGRAHRRPQRGGAHHEGGPGPRRGLREQRGLPQRGPRLQDDSSSPRHRRGPNRRPRGSPSRDAASRDRRGRHGYGSLAAGHRDQPLEGLRGQAVRRARRAGDAELPQAAAIRKGAPGHHDARPGPANPVRPAGAGALQLRGDEVLRSGLPGATGAGVPGDPVLRRQLDADRRSLPEHRGVVRRRGRRHGQGGAGVGDPQDRPDGFAPGDGHLDPPTGVRDRGDSRWLSPGQGGRGRRGERDRAGGQGRRGLAARRLVRDHLAGQRPGEEGRGALRAGWPILPEPGTFDPAKALLPLGGLTFRAVYWMLNVQYRAELLNGLFEGFMEAWEGDKQAAVMLGKALASPKETALAVGQFFKDVVSKFEQAGGFKGIVNALLAKLQSITLPTEGQLAYYTGYLTGFVVEQLMLALALAAVTEGIGAVLAKVGQLLVAGASWVGRLAQRSQVLARSLAYVLDGAKATAQDVRAFSSATLKWIKGLGSVIDELWAKYPNAGKLLQRAGQVAAASRDLAGRAIYWLTIVDRMTDDAALRFIRFFEKTAEHSEAWLAKWLALKNGKRAVKDTFEATEKAGEMSDGAHDALVLAGDVDVPGAGPTTGKLYADKYADRLESSLARVKRSIDDTQYPDEAIGRAVRALARSDIAALSDDAVEGAVKFMRDAGDGIPMAERQLLLERYLDAAPDDADSVFRLIQEAEDAETVAGFARIAQITPCLVP